MLDPQLIRNSLDQIQLALTKRAYTLDVDSLQALDTRRKKIQVQTQALQSERNRRSKQIGKAKAAGEDIHALLDDVESLGDKLKACESELQTVQLELHDILSGIPNTPHETVPAGQKEDDNVEVRRWGEPGQFCNGNDNCQFPFCSDAGSCCQITQGLDPVHAGYPYARAWLYGSECALSRQ